jgi:SpoVK/Ycf46/Vps4 family AAA+-type ATPase
MADPSKNFKVLRAVAKKIDPAFTWDHLVVPATLRRRLRELVSHVRRRGVTALFVGESGTGKRMAAGVLANDLQLDLYRIDLASIVSKFIGETEKNIDRIFAAAGESSLILFFDEADALFGNRSEVKDSHDRYANIELDYLLRQMEQYRGLAILATDHKSALDSAFLRRFRFVVKFPFPHSEPHRN